MTPMSQKDLVLLGLVNPLNQLFYGLRLVTLGHKAGDQLEVPLPPVLRHERKNTREAPEGQACKPAAKILSSPNP